MTHTLPADRGSAVEGAIRAARVAAKSSGVHIHEIETLTELENVSRLLSRVWNLDAASPQMTADLLRALSRTGNYVAGAFLGDELVGAAVAFFASPPSSLHSHIAGVAEANQARNVGYALKLHQRAWALHRGVATVTWTFDPLVRRNGYFNIAKLGAHAVEYLPNFYGEMRDPINAGDQSDRLLVEWSLLDPGVVSLCDLDGAAPSWEPAIPTVLAIGADGGPQCDGWGSARSVLAVPRDIERLRVEDPSLAHAWRLALRDALGSAMMSGGQIVGFDRRTGYVVDPSVSNAR